tara:strand:- start:199 stop:372 length:174 start_codon:yes stop_codon:yes gene_type:complete
MTEVIKEVSVKGYNRKHTFSIERTSVAGYEFVRFIKNGNVVLNCKADEFEKFRTLFL